MKNNIVMLGAVIVALLIGAYAGYAYEKNKFVGITNQMTADFQRQLADASKLSETLMKSGGIPTEVVMKAKDQNFQTDPEGMTLYTFDKDTKDKSNCTGECLVKWPPYLANEVVPPSLPKNVDSIKTADGKMQFTWNGKPLYYFAEDTQAGDKNGDGVGGVWHLAK